MTAANETPSRIDLYVEKIVAYMKLDDAQRTDVVNELRSHLEEAIESAVARGIPRNRAEEEAMERFGTPEALAGKFGTARGKIWTLFEALAFGIAMFATYRIMIGRLPNQPEFITNTHLLLMALAVAVAVTIARLWNRVQVNGTLRIYRFLRPTLVIPFDAIDGVSLDRWHLFGARKVNIRYAGKKAQYSAGWPNARCVGIALEVLAPKAIQPRAVEYFRKLRLTDGQESLFLKTSLTFCWIVLAAILAAIFPPMWRGEGVSVLFAIVLFGSIALVGIQYYAHLSRAKKGIAMLLTAGALLFLLPMAVGRATFLPYGFGHLALLTAILLPLPVVLLWWRGRNNTVLLVASCAWISLAVAIFMRVPAVNTIEPHFLGTSEGQNDTGYGAWLPAAPEERPRFITLGVVPNAPEAEKNVLSIANLNQTAEGSAITHYTLPAGTWSVAGGGEGTSGPLFLRDISQSEADPPVYANVIYRVTDSHSLQELTSSSDTNVFVASMLYPRAVESPDSKYLVTTSMAPGSTYSLAIQNLETGKVLHFDEFQAGSPWHWNKAGHLELLQFADTGAGSKYEGHEIDPESGATSRTQYQLKLPEGYNLTNARSSKYIVARGTTEVLLLNLESNMGVGLPPPFGESFTFSWQPRLNRLAYVSQDNNGTGPQLTLAGPEGIISQMPLSIHNAEQEVASLTLSPDGNKVFAVTQRVASWFMSLGQLKVYDFERGHVQTIGRIPFIGSVLYFVANNSTPYPKVQWTPDSRSIIWSHTSPIYEEDSIRVGTTFLIYPYEDWAERNQFNPVG